MSDETRTCTDCRLAKQAEEFHRAGENQRVYRCRSCRSARRKLWLERTGYREKQAQYRRRAVLAVFGLTVDEYETMLAAQGGVCAMCGEGCSTGRRLAVDHDHKTGRVRGLLCRSCNQGLGRYEAIKGDAERFLAVYGNGNPYISHGRALEAERGTRRVGTAVGTARLTAEAVCSIRARYSEGGVSQRQLALEFMVSQNAIGMVIRRETWAHVRDDETDRS